jgi:hypothetical protein
MRYQNDGTAVITINADTILVITGQPIGTLQPSDFIF